MWKKGEDEELNRLRMARLEEIKRDAQRRRRPVRVLESSNANVCQEGILVVWLASNSQP